MEELKKKENDMNYKSYNYLSRQRGFSVCHHNSTKLKNTVHNNNGLEMKKLPSITIHNGDPEGTNGDGYINTTYDSTYLNPSNTLDSAVAQNNSLLLEKLLTSAANISLEGHNASGGTPIHEAAYQGKVACLRVFLKFGADVNLRDREGWTPLHAAVCGGDANSVLLLLKHGSSINLTTNDGITPIDMALQSEDEEITKALLQADKQCTENEGTAPLASAEDFGSELCL